MCVLKLSHYESNEQLKTKSSKVKSIHSLCVISIRLFILIQSSILCSPGPVWTACLCWRWKTWWSWEINQTPNVSSPTYSRWSITCADMRCPWAAPVTSDLGSSVRPHPPSHPSIASVPSDGDIRSNRQGHIPCTSLMDTCKNTHIFLYFFCLACCMFGQWHFHYFCSL